MRDLADFGFLTGHRRLMLQKIRGILLDSRVHSAGAGLEEHFEGPKALAHDLKHPKCPPPPPQHADQPDGRWIVHTLNPSKSPPNHLLIPGLESWALGSVHE